jgi:ribosomal protein S18 acetylase RimI-like enzyme
VARLHLDHLQTGFRGTPGLRLLEAYYQSLVMSDGACGFVAISKGQVGGYVCGVWEPNQVRASLLRSHWASLAFWGTVQLVVHPRVLVDWSMRLLASPQAGRNCEPAYELRPIVVTPTMRRAGIGALLVDSLRDDAIRRNFDRVYLLVAEDNLAACAFYRKVGFRLVNGSRALPVGFSRYEYVLRGL